MTVVVKSVFDFSNCIPYMKLLNGLPRPESTASREAACGSAGRRQSRDNNVRGLLYGRRQGLDPLSSAAPLL